MSLPSSTARDLFEEVFNTCVKNLHNFITKTDKLYKDLLDLVIGSEITSCIKETKSVTMNIF